MALQQLEKDYNDILKELRLANCRIQYLENALRKIEERQWRHDEPPVDEERTRIAKIAQLALKGN